MKNTFYPIAVVKVAQKRVTSLEKKTVSVRMKLFLP